MKIKDYVFHNTTNQRIELVSSQDIENLFMFIVEATKSGHKFIIYELGECVGDYT